MIVLLAKHLAIAAPAIGAIYVIFGTAPLLLALAISMPLATLATLLESRSLAHASMLRKRGDFASVLKLVYMGMRYGKKSMLASIDGYIGTFGRSSESAIAMEELRGRLALGQKFPEAIRAIDAGSTLNAALRSMADACSAGSSALDTIRTFSERLHSEHRYASLRKSSSLQKYLTLSMLVSSVLPSFALFSFVGYSMLVPSKAQAFAFMLLITVPLPLVYSVIRAHINEVYNYF